MAVRGGDRLSEAQSVTAAPFAGTHRLERLLRPKTIAVIGGGGFAPNVVRECLKMGFDGQIWPVHPTRSEISGVKAFGSIADLPAPPDATFIGVNRYLTIDIVRGLGAMGAGGAICFAAGFLESGAEDADGERLQRELIAAAGNMPVIGPNCYGLINYADGALLWPDQHGGQRLPQGGKGAAILTQSSNIAINLTMQRRGLPVAYVMTGGNQAQTGLSEMALGLIEDERVTALGLHIEGFDSVEGFARLARRARELGKPIVAMKVGRSEAARKATISHTASLAGSDAASDAFLRRLGIARVNSIPSFLETLKLLHAIGPLRGSRLSSMSCSGGEASVMADAAEGRRSIGFPPLCPDHIDRVRQTLGPLVAIANPLDYHTFIWNDQPSMTASFTAMVSGGFDLNLLILDFPRNDRCSDEDWWPAIAAFGEALKTNRAKGAVVASMPENLPEDYSDRLLDAGIVPLAGIAEALDAAEAAAFIGTNWQKNDQRDFATTPKLVDGCARTIAMQDEAVAKSMLREAGLPVPMGGVADASSAVEAAEQIGYPVALKALGIAHKSEVGAVKLNLADAHALASAVTALSHLGTDLYVEKMVSGGVAELIVGVTRDPLFGPVMTVGIGGVLVELLQDSATILLPANTDDIEQALKGLRMFALLDGYRGRPKADLEAAVAVVKGIADFALEHADQLEELDINPLIVCETGKGAWIADALLVTRED